VQSTRAQQTPPHGGHSAVVIDTAVLLRLVLAL
jgi:hypothetical protein